MRKNDELILNSFCAQQQDDTHCFSQVFITSVSKLNPCTIEMQDLDPKIAKNICGFRILLAQLVLSRVTKQLSKNLYAV